MTTAAPTDALGLALSDPRLRENPFPLLGMLRENQPLIDAGDGFYVVSRYEDVSRLLREIKGGMRSSSGAPQLLPPAEEGADLDLNDFMLFQDGAPHTRLRKLVSKAFTPRMVEQLRPEIQACADTCLDAAIERGRLDVAEDLAKVVPSTIICMMLGVPLEDRELFTDWTARAIHGLNSQFDPEGARAMAEEPVQKLLEYFDALIGERRGHLGDDLLSELIRAEEDGDRLSTSELLVQSMGLLVAGFETTIGLIGLGARQLLQSQDELARLREQPALIESAIEECLRIDPPIIATMRVIHEDVEWYGKTVPRDARVIAIVGAANRDPRAYDEPDRFDIARKGPPHWSFGGGLHLCLGAHLARLEAQVAIGTLVRRTRRLELVESSIEWSESLFRVPGKLPVHFEV